MSAYHDNFVKITAAKSIIFNGTENVQLNENDLQMHAYFAIVRFAQRAQHGGIK
jgi:hypothetical protein